MRCLIVYFSVTHSTERIANAIAQGFKEKQIEADLWNILDKPPLDLQGYDILGFGTPVYGFRVPVLFEEAIMKLPALNAKRVFAFMLRGSYLFDAPVFLQKALAEKGAEVSGWFFSMGAGYFMGYVHRGCMTSPTRPNDDDLARARLFGMDIAENKNLDQWKIEIKRPPLVYRLEQFSFSSSYIKKNYRKVHKFLRSKCIRCGKCIESCPAKSIVADLEGFPSINDTCITCRYCQLVCPTGAMSVNESAIDRLVLDYNVRKVLADPNIDKAAVEVKNGKIVGANNATMM